jgi:4-amino-4-deoxy-L-arabinose transferase-like glycosyltransferase
MPADADAPRRPVPLMQAAPAGAGARTLPALLVRQWRAVVVLMLCAYFVAGTFWRMPWKADEPYSFGVVLNIIEQGDWVVPNVAFEPFVEKPPLMYWTGALAALALPNVPGHEAVRVAVLFWMALTCWAVWRTARLLRGEARDWRQRVGTELARGRPGPTLAARRQAGLDAGGAALRDYALGALLLFAGCIGLVEHVHKFIADVPQLAGTAIALYGLVRFAKESEAGSTAGGDALRPALWFGTGIGVAFLGKGVLVPGLFALTVLAAIALLPDFRRRLAWRFYGLSLLAALPWLVIWPAVFWHESTDLFIEWFWVNNVGRFFGFSHLGGEKGSLATTLRSILLTGTPAVWPALAVVTLSLYKLVRQRGRGARAAWLLPQGHLVVALFLLLSIAVVLRSAVLRDVYLMPLQPAMAVLGAPMLLLVPPVWRARAWGAAVALFGALGVVVWAVWAALVVDGGMLLPAWLSKPLSRVLPLPYDMLVHPIAVMAAAGITAVWAVCVWLRPARSGVVAWAAGLGLVWGLLGTLLIPWVDDARSYRPLFQAIKPALQSAQVCVATRGMGESERALMHYETGVRPVKWLLGHSGHGDAHRPNPAARTCDLMLVLDKASENRSRQPKGADWELVWRGSRPGDTNETFSLFQRRGNGGTEALPSPEPIVPLTDTPHRGHR